MEMIDLSGLWQCEIPGQTAEIRLPGTLDESGIGYPDSTDRQWHPENAFAIGLWQEGDPIVTRLTRRFTYEGPVFFSRTLDWSVPRNRRVFLECERARHLSLKVNGQAVPAQSDTCDDGYEVMVTATCDTAFDDSVIKPGKTEMREASP